jgi:hypothetical protein
VVLHGAVSGGPADLVAVFVLQDLTQRLVGALVLLEEQALQGTLPQSRLPAAAAMLAGEPGTPPS